MTEQEWTEETVLPYMFKEVEVRHEPGEPWERHVLEGFDIQCENFYAGGDWRCEMRPIPEPDHRAEFLEWASGKNVRPIDYGGTHYLYSMRPEGDDRVGGFTSWHSENGEEYRSYEVSKNWRDNWEEYTEPEKRMVPLSAEDVPPGSFVRGTNKAEWKPGEYVLILPCASYAILVGSAVTARNYEGLMEHYEILRPNDTEWRRCEKGVDA